MERGFRVLVTTLTKRMAEDLTEYLHEAGLKVRYLHSDVETLERIEIIRDLRLGTFDVLVGINLLREGLDIPECALVTILDADKEGFLRSQTSLIQTIGRAARNVEGKVILYADRMTHSMEVALGETEPGREVGREKKEKGREEERGGGEREREEGGRGRGRGEKEKEGKKREGGEGRRRGEGEGEREGGRQQGPAPAGRRQPLAGELLAHPSRRRARRCLRTRRPVPQRLALSSS